jgi:methyl coenzyme M reductase gamma subunit
MAVGKLGCIYEFIVEKKMFLELNFYRKIPRTTPSGRKVIRYRERERERERKRKTMNLVATTFATQPVCNAARAAHALHSDQLLPYAN